MRPKNQCKKCGYEWIPKSSIPRLCPRCKCRKWDNYTKDKRLFNDSEEAIFNSATLGEAIILLANVHTQRKQYVRYLKKTEQAISITIARLDRLGLLKESALKQNPIFLDTDKLETICLDYCIRKIESEVNNEIQRIKKSNHPERLQIFDDNRLISTKKRSYSMKEKRQHKKLHESLRENKLTNQHIIEKYKEEIIAKIITRNEIEKNRIIRLFSDGYFNNFMIVYFHVFYPEIGVPLSKVIDYYVKWGSEL